MEYPRTFLAFAGLRRLNLRPEERRLSPTQVLNAPSAAKWAVAVGLPVSSYGFYAVQVLLNLKLPIGHGLKLGLVCAYACAVAAFVFCWSSAVAYFIRKYNFSPNACAWAGLPFMIVGSVLLILYWYGWYGSGDGIPVFFLAVTCGYFCRKLAYPSVPE
jgi:hypothetical protein